MTYTKDTIQDFLAELFPFNQLPAATLTQLGRKLQLVRYRMGQAILLREQMPAQISILYEGQARLLGYDPHTQKPVTLQLLKKGEILGWSSLLRGIPCETVIASTETICLALEVTEFFDLLEQTRGNCPCATPEATTGSTHTSRRCGTPNARTSAFTVCDRSVLTLIIYQVNETT